MIVFSTLSLRRTYWTNKDSKRTKTYKLLICRFLLSIGFVSKTVKEFEKLSFVTKSLLFSYRTKTVTICLKMIAGSLNFTPYK